MRYQYAPAGSYADVASGQVLHSAPTFPAFPAKLAVELFEQARHLLGRQRVGLWDPACGAGSLVATVALLRGDHVHQVLASDVDPAAVALARRNLALTTPQGMQARIDHLIASGASTQRVAAARRLAGGLRASVPLTCRVARADVTEVDQLRRLAPADIDVVMADLPYAQQTWWHTQADAPADAALTALQAVLPAHAVIILIARDRRTLAQQQAHRSWKVGHRHARLYRQPEFPPPAGR